MLTKAEAIEIARKHLTKLEFEIGEPIALIESSTIEETFGWIFFYNSKSFLESNCFIDKLIGNAPFIVDSVTKKITETGTSEPIEFYIEKYRKRKSNL